MGAPGLPWFPLGFPVPKFATPWFLKGLGHLDAKNIIFPCIWKHCSYYGGPHGGPWGPWGPGSIPPSKNFFIEEIKVRWGRWRCLIPRF